MSDLWRSTLHHLSEGNFTALQESLGGPQGFDRQIVDWFENGNFDNQPDALAEAFDCACMLGRVRVAAHMLDSGVDPYSGMKTGLSGFHWAASSGRLDVIKLLIERNVPMEIENMYGGTIFGQAMWSAINEWKPDHAEIVEHLIEAGAVVENGYAEWWDEQNVPDAHTKERIANALKKSSIQ